MFGVVWESSGSPSRDDRLAELATMRGKCLQERHLAETRPFHFQVIAETLKDQGYKSWQVDKPIAYVSFIQARGWAAFYPEDAAFLKQKYADVGIDAEKIAFRS